MLFALSRPPFLPASRIWGLRKAQRGQLREAAICFVVGKKAIEPGFVVGLFDVLAGSVMARGDFENEWEYSVLRSKIATASAPPRGVD